MAEAQRHPTGLENNWYERKRTLTVFVADQARNTVMAVWCAFFVWSITSDILAFLQRR